jgi:hypothetical protein
MSKNKGPQNKGNNSSNRPASPAAPSGGSKATGGSTDALDRLSATAAEMTNRHGVPEPASTLEAPGLTLEDSITRAERLLTNARDHYEHAKRLDEKTHKEAQILGAKAIEQAAALKRQQETADSAIAKLRSDTEAELSKKKLALSEAEAELLSRIARVEEDEQLLAEREATCRLTEAHVAEQSARLAERELNAADGFLAEKTRILKPVEEEVNRLRDEREALQVELSEERRKRDEENRRAARAFDEKWAAEEAARANEEAELRRQFDASMAQERQEKLEALRALLTSEREKAEVSWQEELERRTVALELRGGDLEAREANLIVRLRALRADELDLKASQEMLDEDRAGLERKVARLVTERTESLRHELESTQKLLTDARAQRDAYFREMESRHELDRRFGGRSPEEILTTLTAAERERDSLAQQLRERPDANAAKRLSELESERSAWIEIRAVLEADLAKANGELANRRLSAIELEALRKQKEALEVHKQLLDGAVDELRTRVDELTRQEDHRNPLASLTSLDENEDLQSEVRTSEPIGNATPSLKTFAEELRHRIATGVEGRTLYYAERDVRAFLGGLAMTRLMLLQGISGTGKTSLPLAFASATGAGIEIVEVQAGWRDRQDLVGYYNAFHRHYYATNFLQALYKAGTPAYSDRIFLVVLDEINMSRPEQFFADFLSALEQPMSKRRLTLLNDPVAQAPQLMVEGRHLPIPPNVWFVGTANHDESTNEFADKTYDRAHMMEMPRNTGAAQFNVRSLAARKPLSYDGLQRAFTAAVDNQRGTATRATDWLRTAPFVAGLEKQFRVGWGNRLENQLAHYLPVVVESGGSVGEAMDHLLVTKVFRKLKDRHDVRATALEELSESLQKAWESLDVSNPPERCVALLEKEVAVKKGEDLV